MNPDRAAEVDVAAVVEARSGKEIGTVQGFHAASRSVRIDEQIDLRGIESGVPDPDLMLGPCRKPELVGTTLPVQVDAGYLDD